MMEVAGKWENNLTLWHGTSRMEVAGNRWETSLPHDMGLPEWKWQIMRWENSFTLWHGTSRMEVAGNEMGKQFYLMTWDFHDVSGREWDGKTISPFDMGFPGWKWQVMRWETTLHYDMGLPGWKWRVMRWEYNFTSGHGTCNMWPVRWYLFYCGLEWYWYWYTHISSRTRGGGERPHGGGGQQRCKHNGTPQLKTATV